MHARLPLAAGAVALAAALSPAHAANLVLNGGFESVSPSLPSLGFELPPNFTAPTTLDNWTSRNAPGARAFNVWFPGNVAAATTPPGANTAFTSSERQNLANGDFTPAGAPGGTPAYSAADVIARGDGFQGIGLSPDGGAFVALDGDVAFNGPLSQEVSGLVPGQQYLLSFFWAAGMFDNRVEQTYAAGLSIDNQIFFSLGSETGQTARLTTVPDEFVGWFNVRAVFTARNATETLAFLSVGAPSALPPVALLDGISLTAVPVPASALLFGIALAGLGAAVNGRRDPAPVTAA